MSDTIEIAELLTAPLNRTELVQLCRHAGLHPHPGASRQALVQLLGRAVPDQGEDGDPMNRWRKGLIAVIDQYWSQIAPSLVCPARMLKHPVTPDPRPCFKCMDAQVMSCVVGSGYENLIRKNL